MGRWTKVHPWRPAVHSPIYGLSELFGQFRFKMCKYELVLNAENRKENWELDLRKQCNFGCGDFYHIQTELNE